MAQQLSSLPSFGLQIAGGGKPTVRVRVPVQALSQRFKLLRAPRRIVSEVNFAQADLLEGLL